VWPRLDRIAYETIRAGGLRQMRGFPTFRARIRNPPLHLLSPIPHAPIAASAAHVPNRMRTMWRHHLNSAVVPLIIVLFSSPLVAASQCALVYRRTRRPWTGDGSGAVAWHLRSSATKLSQRRRRAERRSAGRSASGGSSDSAQPSAARCTRWTLRATPRPGTLTAPGTTPVTVTPLALDSCRRGCRSSQQPAPAPRN
jgi:hypothetical protein